MNLAELKAKHRDALLALAAEHGLSDLRVFGSVARGEARPESDLDLLVKIGPDVTLLTLARFRRLAGERLGMPVQTADADRLYHLIRDTILRDAQPL